MKFNINNQIRVKLTSLGHWHLIQEHYALFNNSIHVPEYIRPEEDADGWSTWQMWHLFSRLGKYLGNGSPLVFETEVELIGEEK